MSFGQGYGSKKAVQAQAPVEDSLAIFDERVIAMALQQQLV